jgi:sugar lactone lactonase YvrE
MEGLLRRVAGLAVTLMQLAPATAAGQSLELPPDTVHTVFRSDTVPGFGAVGGVASDALGYVYVADFRNAVWRVDPDGRLEKLADGLYGASGNTVGPRGYLWQSSFHGNYVSRISRTGEVETWVDEGLSGPVGIAADSEGDLYVCNCTGGTISRVGADRVAQTFARSELLACPNGITFDDRGDLYVVSFNNTLVVRITPDGEVSRFAEVPGAGGNGHITFARGGFYVTKLRGHQVFRVGRDGTVRVVAGTGEAGEDDGPALSATLTRPNGIAMDATGKSLWVNDLEVGSGLGVGPSVVTLRRIRLVTLADVLGRVDAEDGVEALRAAYAAYREGRPDDDSTGEAIALAFQWMSTGRVAAGVALHEMNAASFPEHAGAQFNLGEAYRYTGQTERAAARYRRVLELEPDHAQARARLELVGGGAT